MLKISLSLDILFVDSLSDLKEIHLYLRQKHLNLFLMMTVYSKICPLKICLLRFLHSANYNLLNIECNMLFLGSFIISVKAHQILQTFRGVTSEQDLLLSTKEKLLKNLSDQNVTDVRCMCNGCLRPNVVSKCSVQSMLF